MFEVDKFPPPPMRRRVLMVVLAVAMAAFITWSMTRKSGLVRNAALHPADVPACSAGQTAGCVGSMTAIIAAPEASGAASAAR
jgi:hypothetical protein